MIGRLHVRSLRPVALFFFLLAAATVAAQPPPAELTPLTAASGVHAGEVALLALQMKLPDGLHTNSNKPYDASVIPITLAFDSTPGITVTELVFPRATDFTLIGQNEPLSVFTGTFEIGVALTIAPTVPAADLKLAANLHYQACDEKQCYFPKTLPVAWTLHVVPPTTRVVPQHADIFGTIAFGHGDKPGAGTGETASTGADHAAPPPVTPASLGNFAMLATNVGYMTTGEFTTFIHNAENGITEKGMFEGRGPLAILLIVFLGGLALNLTPCVLPMIPINLAIIGAGTKAGSRGRGFLLGGVYGAAMAVVYGVLGLIVILTAGTFGTINATWWFNAGIAALFLVLALAMFDVITIDFSGLSSNINVAESSRGSFLVAFGMGAVAALLAGACVAPVVVQVVLFSSNLYAKGVAAALALPFVLGLGMAVPWPIAGAGIAALPKPGAWMVRIKQVFGVVILATALYYAYGAYQIVSSRWVDAAEVNASVQEKLKEGWHPLDEGLAVAVRDQKPVLMDMWATWCKDCLTMDKTTLESADVTSALAGYVKIKFNASNPDDPTVKMVMQRFNAQGLPTYVILRPIPGR